MFDMLAQDIRMRNPYLELQDVQNNIATTMVAENNDLNHLEQKIPDLLNGLIGTKQMPTVFWTGLNNE